MSPLSGGSCRSGYRARAAVSGSAGTTGATAADYSNDAAGWTSRDGYGADTNEVGPPPPARQPATRGLGLAASGETGHASDS
jgi:hypothetical protein